MILNILQVQYSLAFRFDNSLSLKCVLFVNIYRDDYESQLHCSTRLFRNYTDDDTVSWFELSVIVSDREFNILA